MIPLAEIERLQKEGAVAPARLSSRPALFARLEEMGKILEALREAEKGREEKLSALVEEVKALKEEMAQRVKEERRGRRFLYLLLGLLFVAVVALIVLLLWRV